MEKTECFKIRIGVSISPFERIGFENVKQIRNTCGFSISEPTTIVADPFLFVDKGTLFVFYEDKKMYHNGVISMIKTTDLIHWSEPVVVLSETCHLSYPYVFKENEHIYMLPETCEMNSVRLYEGNGELTSFKYKKTILMDNNGYESGFSFSDSSIYKKEDTYFLMTTINDGVNNILKLYTSNSFDGGYEEHPQSPICIGNKYGRNAGSLFEYNGRLFRFAQDCERRYGDNVNLLEVQELSSSQYSEMLVKSNLIPRELSFFKEGGHQFNAVKFRGKYIIATDAKEYHWFIINRILHKIGAYG